MDLESFRKWIQQIYATQDQELDCERCIEALAQYVDIEIAGGEPYLHLPEVEQHLAQCPHCHDLYRALCEIALLESQDGAQPIVPVRSIRRTQARPAETQRFRIR